MELFMPLELSADMLVPLSVPERKAILAENSLSIDLIKTRPVAEERIKLNRKFIKTLSSLTYCYTYRPS
jgi:hypothetical protein